MQENEKKKIQKERDKKNSEIPYRQDNQDTGMQEESVARNLRESRGGKLNDIMRILKENIHKNKER